MTRTVELDAWLQVRRPAAWEALETVAPRSARQRCTLAEGLGFVNRSSALAVSARNRQTAGYVVAGSPMSELVKLSETEVRERLLRLPGWELAEGKLRRTFRFENFIEAFGFMTRVALVAEGLQHHPEWFNVYNRVVVDLATHDVGGISVRDFELAQKMSELAA